MRSISQVKWKWDGKGDQGKETVDAEGLGWKGVQNEGKRGDEVRARRRWNHERPHKAQRTCITFMSGWETYFLLKQNKSTGLRGFSHKHTHRAVTVMAFNILSDRNMQQKYVIYFRTASTKNPNQKTVLISSLWDKTYMGTRHSGVVEQGNISTRSRSPQFTKFTNYYKACILYSNYILFVLRVIYVRDKILQKYTQIYIKYRIISSILGYEGIFHE